MQNSRMLLPHIYTSRPTQRSTVSQTRVIVRLYILITLNSLGRALAVVPRSALQRGYLGLQKDNVDDGNVLYDLQENLQAAMSGTGWA